MFSVLLRTMPRFCLLPPVAGCGRSAFLRMTHRFSIFPGFFSQPVAFQPCYFFAGEKQADTRKISFPHSVEGNVIAVTPLQHRFSERRLLFAPVLLHPQRHPFSQTFPGHLSRARRGHLSPLTFWVLLGGCFIAPFFPRFHNFRDT